MRRWVTSVAAEDCSDDFVRYSSLTTASATANRIHIMARCDLCVFPTCRECRCTYGDMVSGLKNDSDMKKLDFMWFGSHLTPFGGSHMPSCLMDMSTTWSKPNRLGHPCCKPSVAKGLRNRRFRHDDSNIDGVDAVAAVCAPLTWRLHLLQDVIAHYDRH